MQKWKIVSIHYTRIVHLNILPYKLYGIEHTMKSTVLRPKYLYLCIQTALIQNGENKVHLTIKANVYLCNILHDNATCMLQEILFNLI